MIEVICQTPGNGQYTRIPMPANSGTWEATEALREAAYSVDAWTRHPVSVANGNHIIDLHMVRAIWIMHVEPILELRRRIKA